MANVTIPDLAAAGALTGVELVEISQLSATVKITATTLSANASDNSYNDSGTGFGTAGFQVGDRVNVTGFTGDVANNIVVGVITALTTGKMTIGGTDGDVIVNDSAGESVTIAKWISRRATVASLTGGGDGGVVLQVALSDMTTAITTGILKAYIRSPTAFTITEVRASLAVVSSSGTPTVDINVNGSTILSTKLTIDASEKTSVTAATAAVVSSASIADDDEITFDIDVAGTGAKGLIVTIIGA